MKAAGGSGPDGRCIAHILPWPGVGGTEHGTLWIMRAIEEHGFRSIAFCLPTATPVHEFFRDHGIETGTWHAREPRLRAAKGWLYRSAQLGRDFVQRGVDLVHCADATLLATPVTAAKLTLRPVFCHVRNRHDRVHPDNRRVMRFVDRFLFCSMDTQRKFGFSPRDERSSVVYDGLPPILDAAAGERSAVREELGIPAHAPLIGMVARVEPQKDFATLARAAARVVAQVPDVHFLVVGGTDLTLEQRQHFGKVQQIVAECGVTDCITFCGFRNDVARVVSAFDVFVLSTHWEGLPLVLLEALALGKPTVATAVDGIPEVLKDGVTGLLHAHEDDAGLADAILRFLRDPGWARQLGEAGRRLVLDRFSPQQNGAQLAGLYRAALGEGNPG